MTEPMDPTCAEELMRRGAGRTTTSDAVGETHGPPARDVYGSGDSRKKETDDD